MINFVTSMAVVEKEQIKSLQPALFLLEGTEEEVFYKLQINGLAIIAKKYSIENNTELSDELDKLVKKYNIKK